MLMKLIGIQVFWSEIQGHEIGIKGRAKIQIPVKDFSKY